MATKQQTYQVQFDIKITTTVEINAVTFEEALEKARRFKEKDIVDFDTDFIDGDIEVMGIFK